MRKLSFALLIVTLASCSISPHVRKTVMIGGSILGGGMIAGSAALSLSSADPMLQAMTNTQPSKALFYTGFSILVAGVVALIFDLNYSDTDN
ncbi:MAG: hypothetical protein LBS82_00515 [Spirochaetaceae bacterium]|jgi:hypothetical protein|nr:hypothetical protein [Spirochaetaceae bacterium]